MVGEEGSFVYLLCIDSTGFPVIDSRYEKLKEDVLGRNRKEWLYFLEILMLE